MTPAADSHRAVDEADVGYRPGNAVTAILSPDGVDRCLSDLSDAGVDVTSADVLHGPDGAEIPDRDDGSGHGLRARLGRAVQMLGSSENELVNYSTALQHGRAVVLVPVADERQADAAVAVLGRHSDEWRLYFRSAAAGRTPGPGPERVAQVPCPIGQVCRRGLDGLRAVVERACARRRHGPPRRSAGPSTPPGTTRADPWTPARGQRPGTTSPFS